MSSNQNIEKAADLGSTAHISKRPAEQNPQLRSPDGSSPHNCDSQEDVLPLPRVIFHLNALRRHCLSPTAQACEALTPVDTDPYRASALSV
jgi:hypothetical protein